MLDAEGVSYQYREYRDERLTAEEIRAVLKKLGAEVRAVLRNKDKVYVELGLDGTESDAQLIELMAEHPTLLQRPIGVRGQDAVLGRPVERLLELERDAGA